MRFTIFSDCLLVWFDNNDPSRRLRNEFLDWLDENGIKYNATGVSLSVTAFPKDHVEMATMKLRWQ